MQEASIVALIKSSSAEIVVAAALACVITIIIKRSHKLSVKAFLITSFILGTAISFLLGLFLSASVTAESFKKALSADSLAVTITAFVKKTVFLEGSDLKIALEKLLSSIILSDNLDKVVEEILLKLSSSDKAVARAQLKEILRENTSQLDEDKLDAVIDVIIDALHDEDTKT